MKTTQVQTEKEVVQEMRRIREKVSREIQDMTFEEERAYLDNLLAEKQTPASDEAYALNSTT